MTETVLEALSKKQIIFFGLVLLVGLSAFFLIGGTKGIEAEFLRALFVDYFLGNFWVSHDPISSHTFKNQGANIYQNCFNIRNQ